MSSPRLKDTGSMYKIQLCFSVRDQWTILNETKDIISIITASERIMC